MSKRRRLTYALAGVAAALAIAVLFCPRPALYGDTPFSTAIVDRDGGLMRLHLAADERYRLRYSLQDIAQPAIDATLLYEDRHFYTHFGVNPLSLMRAAWTTYVRRGRVMGASTITMQLARLRFGLDTRSPAGKLRQIARAIQLERHYGKDELLEAYLNLAPYGGNIEGIGTAARIYFGKPPSQLSLTEALALAVIPQNPVQRDPTTTAGYARMNEARNRLLEIWGTTYGTGDATRAQFSLPLAVRSTSRLPFSAPHFSRTLDATQFNGGGEIATTIDPALQALLERQLHRYVEARHASGIRNASALLVDSRNMEVLATVGSADFFDSRIEGQVDGTAAKRSPGSTLKPFVYAMAIDRGIVHPGSLLTDAPTRFTAYAPENFDRGFMGPVTAQNALIYSRNVPAIQLLSQVGHEPFHSFLIDAGVTRLRSAAHYGLAMILGGNELTMRELAALYAMLANGGEYRPLEASFKPVRRTDGRRLLSREASFLTLEMLRQNPRPDGLELAAAGTRLPVAWKTGTSYAFRDAWTVGITGPFVLAVWVGNFDGSGNPAFVGRSAAAPLFFDLVDALQATRPAADFEVHLPPGLNVRRVDICAGTGDLPGRHCPATQQSWFIPGVSPIRVSQVHRAVRVDTATGLRACSFDPATTHEAVFEFWPSDLLALFRQAGIAIKPPPTWSPECSLDVQSTAGQAPKITSPSGDLIYHARVEQRDNDAIALQATTDSDVETIYWFIDNALVAEAGRDETVLWKPQTGEHRVLAVDDLGRSATQRLVVAATR